jgi:hypothetical protein
VTAIAQETKAAPRKHHFVPQFYLRGFVGKEDQLFVIDRPSRRTFRTAPKNVAAERDFNRIDVAGMDPNAIEKALAEFEGKVAPALERVKTAKSLDNKKDRDAVMNLICTLEPNAAPPNAMGAGLSKSAASCWPGRQRHEPAHDLGGMLAPPTDSGPRRNLLWRADHQRLPKACRSGVPSSARERR